MITWLIDTALLKAINTPRAIKVRVWAETNRAELYLSSASLAEIARAIAKTPASQPSRREALRVWLDNVTSGFGDRVIGIDAEIALCAGPLIEKLAHSHGRHRLHDAILVATAQVRGHGLLTRRDATFGPWTGIPIAMP